MPTNAKSLLTIEQAAVELDKSPVTVRRYVQTGKLAHYRIGGEVRSTQPTVGPDDIRPELVKYAQECAGAAITSGVIAAEHAPGEVCRCQARN